MMPWLRSRLLGLAVVLLASLSIVLPARSCPWSLALAGTADCCAECKECCPAEEHNSSPESQSNLLCAATKAAPASTVRVRVLAIRRLAGAHRDFRAAAGGFCPLAFAYADPARCVPTRFDRPPSGEILRTVLSRCQPGNAPPRTVLSV